MQQVLIPATVAQALPEFIGLASKIAESGLALAEAEKPQAEKIAALATRLAEISGSTDQASINKASTKLASHDATLDILHNALNHLTKWQSKAAELEKAAAVAPIKIGSAQPGTEQYAGIKEAYDGRDSLPAVCGSTNGEIRGSDRALFARLGLALQGKEV